MKLLIGLALLIAATACAAPAQPETVEYKLAVIQHGGYVAPNDPLVGQFKRALDALGPRCAEPRSALGDYAIAGEQALRKRGVTDETPLSVLVHLGASLPPSTPAMACDQVLAAYILLRAR